MVLRDDFQLPGNCDGAFTDEVCSGPGMSSGSVTGAVTSGSNQPFVGPKGQSTGSDRAPRGRRERGERQRGAEPQTEGLPEWRPKCTGWQPRAEGQGQRATAALSGASRHGLASSPSLWPHGEFTRVRAVPPGPGTGETGDRALGRNKARACFWVVLAKVRRDPDSREEEVGLVDGGALFPRVTLSPPGRLGAGTCPSRRQRSVGVRPPPHSPRLPQRRAEFGLKGSQVSRVPRTSVTISRGSNTGQQAGHQDCLS